MRARLVQEVLLSLAFLEYKPQLLDRHCFLRPAGVHRALAQLSHKCQRHVKFEVNPETSFLHPEFAEARKVA